LCNRLLTNRCAGQSQQGVKTGTVTKVTKTKFTVGELVNHQLFSYRGVIVGVDQAYQSTEEWYEAVARSRPPKDKPWYHVLVYQAAHSAQVAERNLERDNCVGPIRHPKVEQFFSHFENGRYRNDVSSN